MLLHVKSKHAVISVLRSADVDFVIDSLYVCPSVIMFLFYFFVFFCALLFACTCTIFILDMRKYHNRHATVFRVVRSRRERN